MPVMYTKKRMSFQNYFSMYSSYFNLSDMNAVYLCLCKDTGMLKLITFVPYDYIRTLYLRYQ